MNRNELLALARQVLTLPTAPYHEQRVKAFVLQFCRQLPGVRVEQDRGGNVIARYRRGAARIPLVLVAHMDHPGFEILDAKHAEFLGGVPREMFARGGRVRVYGAKNIHRAKLSRFNASAWPKRKLVELRADGPLRKGDFAMWDLPAFRLAGDTLRAAAIDDLLGTTMMLATLAELSRLKLSTHVWCAFTRAEEVGFQGALALVRSAKIPKRAFVISIEMSKQRLWARIGNGPVVRVGDRTSVFDPHATAFLLRAADRCRQRQPAFRSQRCLMDGGTCEATAFAGFGYRAGGLCLPLGNYHNIGNNLRPSAEYVSTRDLQQLLQLTVAATEESPAPAASDTALRRRLLSISRTAPRPLEKI